MKATILYRKMKFFYEVQDDACWFHLDGIEGKAKKYTLKINADRDVYASLIFEDKVIEGYIIENNDKDKSPIPDNYPIDETLTYKFVHLKKPGYYL